MAEESKGLQRRAQLLTEVTKSFLVSVRRFAALLPAIAADDSSRVDLLVASQQVVTAAEKLAEASVVDSDDTDGVLATLEEGVSQLQRETALFEIDVLADQSNPPTFDEETWDRKISEMSDDDLRKLLHGLDDCSDADPLDKLSVRLDGIGLAPITRLARLKLIIMIIVKLLLRIKVPNAELLDKLIRQLFVQIDRLVKPKDGAAQALGGQPPTEPEPGTRADEERVCLVSIRIDGITAEELANVDGADGWTFDLSLDGVALPQSIAGGFDTARTPVDFVFKQDAKRTRVTTYPGCQARSATLTVVSHQGKHIGRVDRTVSLACDGKPIVEELKMYVYRSGHTGVHATLTFKFTVEGHCTVELK